MKRRKYLNEPTRGFDSKTEARVARDLELLKRCTDPRTRVVEIERQVTYELIPAQRDEQGKLIERAVSYTADFRLTYQDGHIEVVDVKSPRTRRIASYIIKRKLMLLKHAIRIVEM